MEDILRFYLITIADSQPRLQSPKVPPRRGDACFVRWERFAKDPTALGTGALAAPPGHRPRANQLCSRRERQDFVPTSRGERIASLKPVPVQNAERGLARWQKRLPELRIRRKPFVCSRTASLQGPIWLGEGPSSPWR